MNDNVLIILPFPCGWACVLLVSSSSTRYTSDDVVDGERERSSTVVFAVGSFG